MGGGLHPPLSVLGTWVPNYVNPVTRDWTFPALIIVLYILAFACVALRVFARVVYMRNAGIDDMFMVLALVCCIRQGHCHLTFHSLCSLATRSHLLEVASSRFILN